MWLRNFPLYCVLALLYARSAASAGEHTASTANLPSSEMNALHELYNATQGWNWLWRPYPTQWSFTPSANPCTQHWQGILCILPAPHTFYYVSKIALPLYGLVGSLPATMGDLPYLTELELYSNALTGTIPSTLAKLLSMQDLVFTNNRLTGPVPSFLSDMVNLTSLYLDGNLLKGTLPPGLGNLRKLQAFAVDANELTGSLPPSYSGLSSLTTFLCNNNVLSGTIPSFLGGLRKLTEVNMRFNGFSGPVPDSLCQASMLKQLYLEGNELSGTIPADLKGCRNLTALWLNQNLLTGFIPDIFGSLPRLTELYLDDNFFTGRIPQSFGDLTGIDEVYLASNYLTGTIPNSVGGFQTITSLYVDDNFLTGSLPASLVNMTTCQVLFLGGNLLHGTIPTALDRLSKISELVLSSNMLSGSVSTNLSSLSLMSTLLLSYNRFTGSIDGVVNASAQLKLSVVQVDNNQLTGTLPVEVFRLPALQTFVALSNCFHGSIPEAACNASALSTLVLDGLSSATSCRRTLPSGAYLLSRSVGGTLPVCLFQLPSLQTFHVSGNSFSGSIPDVPLLPANIMDLSMSHNQLTGTFPLEFQQRAWLNFDASYNRVTGTLSSEFGTVGVNLNSSAVSLENNRLSGRIPGSLQQMLNVSVLGTNLFECNLAGSNLPQHDSGRSNYQCGSTSFNVQLLIWLCLAILTAAIACWCWARPVGACAALAQMSIHWYQSSMRLVGRAPVFTSAMHAADTVCRASACSAVYMVVVLLPCYLLLSRYYGTLTHQYAWTVSAAFLSGAVPVAVELPLWMLFLGMVVVLMLRAQRDTVSRELPSVGKTAAVGPAQTRVRNVKIIRALFVAINVVVVVGVNVLYVYIAIYQSSALLVLAQVLMSFFKLLWNTVCMDAILLALVKMLAPELWNSDSRGKYHAAFQTMLLGVSLLNSIAIPCLVVAAISPDCFYNAFQEAPVVRAQYRVAGCEALVSGGTCLQSAHVVFTTEYDAPYSYNYQCSSSLITYYAPAYVNLCIVAAFVAPLAKLAQEQAASSAIREHTGARICFPCIEPLLGRGQESAARVGNVSQHLVTITMYFGVLMTFGVVLPPLGVALATTIAIVSLVSRVEMGRFLSTAEKQGRLDQCAQELAQRNEGVGSPSFLRSALWMLVTLSCLFYTLFLFDTLGDAVGFRSALWVLIVVPLLALCAGVAGALRLKLFGFPNEQSRDGSASQDGANVELGKVGSEEMDVQETINVLVQKL